MPMRVSPQFRKGFTGRPPLPSLDCLDVEARRVKCLELLDLIGVGQYKARWGELIFRCPLPDGNHLRGDRNPSANLNWSKLLFACHVCGGSGIIAFIQRMTGMSKREAFQWLLHDVDGSKHYVMPDIEPQSHHELAELMPFMCPPHPYLLNRGIPYDNIVKHLVGYDSTADCIIIPVFWQQDLIGWQTRPVDDANITDSRPKYMCSTGMKRGRVLYNGDVWRDTTVVVESPLTVVAKSHLDEHDYAFVATMGGPTQHHLELLADCDPLTLWYDADDAGRHYTKLIGDALQTKTDVFVAQNPSGLDADELDDATVIDILENPVPYEKWKLS